MINRVVVDNASGRILFTDEVETIEGLTEVLDGQTGMENTDLVLEHTHTYKDGQFVYVGDKIVNEYVLDFVRFKRGWLLKKYDWTQVPDALTPEKRAEWTTYRQALRDLPVTCANTLDCDDIPWPTPPT